MKVVKSLPPNYNEIVAVFGANAISRAVFTYGDTIYAPTGTDLAPDLHAHEEMHELQQRAMGVERWWYRYLHDPNFRLMQEAEAYAVQYRSLSSRQLRRRLLPKLCKDLSGPMYGKIITKDRAKELITNGTTI